jgi:hypothetical protein
VQEQVQSKHSTAHRWRTTTSKPPEPIIMIGQSEAEVRSYLLPTLLYADCAVMLSRNPFGELNRHVLTFLHPICSVQDHSHTEHRWRCSKTPYLTETPGRKRTENQGKKRNQKPDPSESDESVRFRFTLTRRRRRSGCPECSLLWTRKNYGNVCLLLLLL